MREAYVEDVARSLVMSGASLRDHILDGLGPHARAAVMDELVFILGQGVSQQDIEAARACAAAVRAPSRWPGRPPAPPARTSAATPDRLM